MQHLVYNVHYNSPTTKTMYELPRCVHVCVPKMPSQQVRLFDAWVETVLFSTHIFHQWDNRERQTFVKMKILYFEKSMPNFPAQTISLSTPLSTVIDKVVLFRFMIVNIFSKRRLYTSDVHISNLLIQTQGTINVQFFSLISVREGKRFCGKLISKRVQFGQSVRARIFLHGSEEFSFNKIVVNHSNAKFAS